MTGGADKGCFLGRSECPPQKSSHAGMDRSFRIRAQCAICHKRVGEIELLCEMSGPRSVRDKTAKA